MSLSADNNAAISPDAMLAYICYVHCSIYLPEANLQRVGQRGECGEHDEMALSPSQGYSL